MLIHIGQSAYDELELNKEIVRVSDFLGDSIEENEYIVTGPPTLIGTVDGKEKKFKCGSKAENILLKHKSDEDEKTKDIFTLMSNPWQHIFSYRTKGMYFIEEKINTKNEHLTSFEYKKIEEDLEEKYNNEFMLLNHSIFEVKIL